MTFIDQSLIKVAFEDPPDALNIVVVQGNVGIVHVQPITDAFGHPPPFLLISED